MSSASPADFSRPIFHLTPPSGWLNDPNGPLFYRGESHVFYQHNPQAPAPGPMHWGHAKSPDLVHWRHLPISISPGPEPYDKDGAWSGSAVIDEGRPTLVYTGVFPEAICLATSGDGMLSFRKHPDNPVARRPPSIAKELAGFRDPFLWREGEAWYMIVGSGFEGVGGAVLLFRGRDLTHWEYLNPLLAGKLPDDGEMWECPNFFPVGEERVLLVSVHETVVGMVGGMEDLRFRPERRFIADIGDCYYASQCQLESPHGPVVHAWAWSWPRSRTEGSRDASWAGLLALPRTLSFDAEGGLLTNPVEETALLRQRPVRRDGIRLSDRPGEEAAAASDFEAFGGTSAEIEVSFAGIEAEKVGLRVFADEAGTEETLIEYDPAADTLTVDASRSSRAGRPAAASVPAVVGGPAGLRRGGDARRSLAMRVFVDRSVVEVFLDGRVALTTRVYPSDAGSRRIEPFVRGGHCEVPRMTVWEMGSCLIEGD